MNIVILGAGKTGSYAAAVLSKEGHNVILIDTQKEAVANAARDCDLATVHAHLPNVRLFSDLMEKSPHLLFAATGDDETNLVACAMAKHLGFPKTVARVKSRDYLGHSQLNFSRLFHVDYFISPEILAAQDLYKMLIHSGDLAVEHFAHGAVHMRTVQVPDLWDRGGLPICKLGLPDEMIAGLIRRKMSEGEAILIPNGSDHILPGDQITLVGRAKAMGKLHEIFNTPQDPIRSVILVGGSQVAVHLAHFLAQQKIAVRLIEKSARRCEELADLLPFATIINRDGHDPSLLRSEKVQDADAFVACTDSDETNFLIAALGGDLGAKKSIAQITKAEIVPLLEKCGVIGALSARVNVANRISAILDEGTTLSIASLSSDAAKIVELKIPSSSKVIGIPLADLSLPKGLLIAVIESQGKVSIGKGHHILKPEDVVIAICDPEHIPALQQLFH